MTAVLIPRIATRLAAAAMFMLSSGTAVCAADPYPSKPIRIIVPAAASSGPDVVARLIGSKLTEAWGHQVVTDNRSGGSGSIGAELAARATPDGYTFFVATSQALIATLFFEKPSYDLIRNFSPVTLIATTPYVLVASPTVPVRSVKELVTLARGKPGSLLYGSAGTGGALHLAAEMFQTMAGIKLVHVPYKSVVYALIDVMGGQVQLAFSAMPAAFPIIKQGKLRALAVSSRARTPLAPDLETIGESVPGYENTGWYALFAPLKTPDAVLAKLHTEVVSAVRSADVRAKLQSLGADPVGTTRNELAAFLNHEAQKLRKFISISGIKPE